MAALLVGSIALGVDKLKAHRAKGKERAAARAAATSTTSTTTSAASLDDETTPPCLLDPSRVSSKAQRPGIDKRGRKGYTEYHTATLSSMREVQTGDVHPAERGGDGYSAACQTSAGTGTGTGLDTNDSEESRRESGGDFVDDEKERLRRFYEQRDGADGHGMRGRASEDLRRSLPAYEDGRGERGVAPPSYEVANAAGRR